MKLIFILLLQLFFVLTLYAQVQKNDYPYKEKYSYDGSDCDFEVDLEVNNPKLEIGKDIGVKYTINVTGAFCPLYNPSFNSLIPNPGQLAIYNENREYVMDLAHWMSGSRRGPNRGDWVFLHGGSFIGSKKSFTTKDSFATQASTLKEGTYHLQMIFYQSFVSTPPEDITPPQDKSYFYKTFSQKEACRSNSIKINIVKAK